MDAKLKKDFSKIDNILSEYADKEGSLLRYFKRRRMHMDTCLWML